MNRLNRLIHPELLAIALVGFIGVTFLLKLAIAQGPPVPTVSGSNNSGLQTVYTYSGSNITYICEAESTQSLSSLNITAATNANPVSFTSTAHGFDYQAATTSTPIVYITGATGGWAVVNGPFIATPTGANTFTIPINSTALGALTGTLVASTRAPRTNQLRWRIRKLVYDGGGNLIWSGWPAIASGNNPPNLPGGTAAFAFACGSLTTYGYQ